jgi:hypothetical protein
MKSKTWLLAGMVACVLVVAGCGKTPGDGTGLDGKWTGSIEPLLTATSTKLPVAVDPSATMVFDGGALTITLKPDIPVVGWIFKVVAEGTYTEDNSTSLDKMTLSLSKVSLKFLFFKIPLKDLTVKSQAIYKIKDLNTLYILPGYDKLSDTMRAAFEAAPDAIPWDLSVTVDGKTYSALKLNRAA